jgi:hypothetical protein
LSLRVKEDQGEGSVPAGGATRGHTARQPPVQFDTSVPSPLNVYTGKSADVTKAGPPSRLCVCKTLCAEGVAVGAAVAAGVGVDVAVWVGLIGPTLPPPPLQPVTRTAPASQSVATEVFFMKPRYVACLKHF